MAERRIETALVLHIGENALMPLSDMPAARSSSTTVEATLPPDTADIGRLGAEAAPVGAPGAALGSLSALSKGLPLGYDG
jgi:hypothetical protein